MKYILFKIIATFFAMVIFTNVSFAKTQVEQSVPEQTDYPFSCSIGYGVMLITGDDSDGGDLYGPSVGIKYRVYTPSDFWFNIGCGFSYYSKTVDEVKMQFHAFDLLAEAECFLWDSFVVSAGLMLKNYTNGKATYDGESIDLLSGDDKYYNKTNFGLTSSLSYNIDRFSVGFKIYVGLSNFGYETVDPLRVSTYTFFVGCYF